MARADRVRAVDAAQALDLGSAGEPQPVAPRGVAVEETLVALRDVVEVVVLEGEDREAAAGLTHG